MNRLTIAEVRAEIPKDWEANGHAGRIIVNAPAMPPLLIDPTDPGAKAHLKSYVERAAITIEVKPNHRAHEDRCRTCRAQSDALTIVRFSMHESYLCPSCLMVLRVSIEEYIHDLPAN